MISINNPNRWRDIIAIQAKLDSLKKMQSLQKKPTSQPKPLSKSNGLESDSFSSEDRFAGFYQDIETDVYGSEDFFDEH